MAFGSSEVWKYYDTRDVLLLSLGRVAGREDGGKETQKVAKWHHYVATAFKKPSDSNAQLRMFLDFVSSCLLHLCLIHCHNFSD